MSQETTTNNPKTHKLVPHVKAAWLAALRSGKYEQGMKMLRTTDDKYCCLGVLCDIGEKKNWKHTGCLYGYETISKVAFPPINVIRNAFALGASSIVDIESMIWDNLVKMNDDGESFIEIANWIEANL